MVDKEKKSFFEKSELARSSLILFLLLNVANLFNYLFHLAMARMLTPADYGILAVLTSIIYIFTVPTLSIQTLISKKVTEFHVRKETSNLKSFFVSTQKKLLKSAFLLFVGFSLLSFFLTDLLGISFRLLFVTGFVIFGALLSPLALGTLQGMKKFYVFGINQILGSLLKLIIAVTLVFFGFRVYGALAGFIIGIFLTFVIALPFLKDIYRSKNVSQKSVTFFSYDSFPTLLAILAVILMYSLDIILAKIFFDPTTAGEYAVASMFGKMIFLGTLAVGNALFPISSEKFLNKSGTTNLIKKTLIVISIICLLAIALYFSIPALLISLLFGPQYLGIAPILGYIGITFSLLSLLNLIVLYKISTNTFGILNSASLIFYLVIQIGLMTIYQTNLYLFTLSFMIAVCISFLGNLLLLYAQR